jgi:chromosome segregation ATPase
MEENTKRIIEIEVDTDNAIQSLRELGEQVAKNKTRLDELKKEGKENSDEFIKLANENKVLTQQMRQTEKQIQNNIKQQKAQEESLVQLRAKLANLNKQYDEMSGFDRLGVKGQELQKTIKALSDQISGLEANTGRYQRNVGNYKSALEGLSGSFKAAGLSTAGFDKSLKLLNGNPIMLLLTGLVTVIQNISKAFKNNEENLDRWKLAVAPIGRLVELTSNAMQQFASKILNVVEAGKSFLSWVGTMLERVPKLGDRIKSMNEEMRDSIALEKEAQDLRNAHRTEEVEQAKASLESQRLLTKAYDKANYTAKERLDFLRQATKIEQDRADAAEQLAKRELELARQRASISKNDSKTNDERAAKEAAYYQAQQQREALQTSLKRRESQLLSQIASEQKEAARAAEEAAKKEAEQRKKEQAEREKEIEEQKKYEALSLAEMQKAEDALNNIIEDAFEKRRAIEDTAYQRRHDALLAAMVAEEEAHGTQTELYQAYMTQWEALETQHSQNLLAIDNDRIAKEQAAKDAAEKKDAERIKREIALEYSKYENVAKITGSISDILEAAAGDNEELVMASKIAALAEVAIQQGVAISKAVAAAADVPYPGNILAIASSVASALAAIVPAIKSINSAKLARGTSYVQGPGTETSDSVPAMLSKGEGVVNAKANRMFPGVVGAMNDASVGIWSPMMSMLRNSGGAPAQVASPMQMSEVQMATAFRAAVEDLNLYVSVDEINRGQKSVKVVENLGAM